MGKGYWVAYCHRCRHWCSAPFAQGSEEEEQVIREQLVSEGHEPYLRFWPHNVPNPVGLVETIADERYRDLTGHYRDLPLSSWLPTGDAGPDD